jgi:hypothetical protein
MKHRKIAALGLLCLFGAAVLPLQSMLQREAQAAHFQKTALSINLRERIGQAGFLAALTVFGRPDNGYWGFMAAPFVLLGWPLIVREVLTRLKR